jgi:hypothetical protein
MSKKFLTPVGLPSGTSNPSSGAAGDLFFRSDLGQIQIYTGSAWEAANQVDNDSIVNVLAEFGLVGGDSGTPNTTSYISQVDGGAPSTTEYIANYSGGQPDNA